MSGPEFDAILGKLDRLADREPVWQRALPSLLTVLSVVAVLVGAGAYYYQTRDRADAQHAELKATIVRENVEPVRAKAERIDTLRENQINVQTRLDAVEKVVESIDSKLDRIIERLPARRRGRDDR